MKRMKKCTEVLSLLLLTVALNGCHINDFKEFTDYYIAFAPGSASYTEVKEAASLVAQYPIHFCTVKRDETVSVTVEAIPGDGLKEGVDYKVISSATQSFPPGVYDKSFVIEWLPGSIDASKDNSLTLLLSGCSDPDIILGVPGPSGKYKSMKITKKK